MVSRSQRIDIRYDKERLQIDHSGFRVIFRCESLEKFWMANDLVEFTDSKRGKDFADVLRDCIKEVDDSFRGSAKLGSEFIILSGNTCGAVVEMALPDKDTTECDEG